MDISTQIKNNPKYTIAALIRLYSYQTTANNLSLGFNKSDGPFLSKLATIFLKTGKLDNKQIKAAARLLPKYAGQLLDLEPVDFEIEEVKKEPIQKQKRLAALINKEIRISFPRTFEDARRIKSLSGRKYIKKFDYWSCPVSLRTTMLLKRWGFEFDKKLENWYQRYRFTMDDLINKICNIPENDFKILTKRQEREIKKNHKIKPIRFNDNDKRCTTCKYVDQYKCGICDEIPPAEVLNNGCLNWKKTDTKYF